MRVIALSALLALPASIHALSVSSPHAVGPRHKHLARTSFGDANETEVEEIEASYETSRTGFVPSGEWDDVEWDPDYVEDENEGVVEPEAEDGGLEARSSSIKVGLAWAGNSDGNIQHFKTSHTKYIYTWSPYCPADAKKHGLTCCPMLWGTKQIGSFESNKYKGGNCIMGMNEVNVPSQGYLSVSAGISLWNAHVRPLKKKGYKLISPSVTSGSSGLTWMKQFFAQCSKNYHKDSYAHCGVDAVAMHYYGMDADDFISYAEKFHALTGGNVWVTEIACQNFGDKRKGQCNKGDVWGFMDKTTAWMKRTGWVEAYFFFGLFQDMYNVNPLNRLVTNKGLPNDLGNYYISGA